jgi:hypothetical protein
MGKLKSFSAKISPSFFLLNSTVFYLYASNSYKPLSSDISGEPGPSI